MTNNSKWKVQTATDAIIVTFTPSQSATERGFKITKEPLAGGLEQIRIASGCNNMFGCSTDEFETALAFKTYVKAGDQ